MIIPQILMREGDGWRQYLVVFDACVAVVNMTPAGVRGCWNFGRVDIQGARDWLDMSCESIVTWKLAADDGRTAAVERIPDSGFQKRLLARVDAAMGGAS